MFIKPFPVQTFILLWAAAMCALPSNNVLADPAAPAADRWGPLRLLEGSWRGDVVGRLGEGSGVRRYEFLFGDMYLMARHTSVRLPQPESPDGDHHRELAIYSYDRERETLVLREFNVEGHVLRYSCDVDGQRIVCSSESIESGAGMRARMTLEIENPYQFEENFELAAPGEELAHYLTVRWTRVPDLSD